jgi:hypothetical protein
MDPVYEDLDRHYDREEYMQYLQDSDLEETVIKSPKEAVKILKDQLITGKDQSYDFLIRSLNVLMKEYDLDDEEFDESDLKVTFDFEVENKLRRQALENSDRDTRLVNRVLSLRSAIYSAEKLDAGSIDGDFTTALWMLGNPVSSNRNINIRRK